MSSNTSGTRQKFEITNLDQEKKKFFFDNLYNPQFEYLEDHDEESLTTHGEVSTEFLQIAKNILDNVIRIYGSEQEFIEVSEGAHISREQTDTIISEYIDLMGIRDVMKLSFSNNYIPRTAVKKSEGTFTLQIRLPLDYREKNLLPILQHEIGTHVFRWLNEISQPWSQRHKEFKFGDYLVTEEGLAVLHFQIENEHPHLWMPALYYYAAYHAQILSFAELAKLLEKYVPDLDRRWKICLRVKRGLTDTSQPGAYTKDQIYLKGTILIARYLKNNEFDATPLYLGKLAVEDLERARIISPDYVARVPAFVTQKEYGEKITKIIKLNKLLS